MLEIRKNRFSKPYENDFFRILAGKLAKKFDDLKLNGVFIGSPLCTKESSLQIDALLVTETGIAIIDFKNYKGQINIPNENHFELGQWTIPSGRSNNPSFKIISGGSRNKNPYNQVILQKEKLNNILLKYILPKIIKGENIEAKDTYSVVCFQQPITLNGSIPGILKRLFYIADPNSIIDTISDLFYVSPNEWKGKITGYKLTTNTFDQIKRIFLADSYDPFADNSLFAEFDKIKFPEIDTGSKQDQIDAEFEKLIPLINEFIKTDIPVLVINADITSYYLDFVNKLTSAYLTSKVDTSTDDNIESKVCYLAPTNRHVVDLVRRGAPSHTASLYGKLYDYEHSTIELLSNSMNEKEVFPLLENDDPPGMLYIIFNAHVIYNFESSTEDLVKFGSGSLCNDTLTYLDVKNGKNKVILINDPFFYGYRAETISNKLILESNAIKFIELELVSRPVDANQKNIADLVKNLHNKQFNHFSFNKNPNINYIIGDKFNILLEDCCKQDLINDITILTREKNENKDINNWIRRNKGILDIQIQKGDVIWIKNKALIPEETDPFSIPKYVLSGDIGEVIKVYDRYSFSSVKYKFDPIEVTKCKIKLRDYGTVRTLYVSTNSIEDITYANELKKHIQIRNREIVDEYLKNHDVRIEDILQSKELEEYMLQMNQLLDTNELFTEKNDEMVNNEIDKKTRKLNAKWKINKRKEFYVKNELIRDINSEYFKISQLVHFDFAWAVCLKSSYSYQFKEAYLVEYNNELKNIERFHQYLYSALSCSEKLNIHNFIGINPWFGVNTQLLIGTLPKNSDKNQILMQIKSNDTDEKDRFLQHKYKLKDLDSKLVKMCRWVLEKLEGKTEFKLQSIDHFPYQEKYQFINGNEKITLILSYNKNWEIKAPKNNADNEIYRCITDSSNYITKEPIYFIEKYNWQIEEISKLQIALQTRGAYIYQVDVSDWKYDIKITCDNNDCSFQLFYNNNSFFSKINIISCEGTETLSVLLESINELKAE